MNKLPRKELEARFDLVVNTLVAVGNYAEDENINTLIDIVTLLVSSGRAEGFDPKINNRRHILQSEWLKVDGLSDSRLVVYKREAEHEPFVVHAQVIDDRTNKKHYLQGTYCKTLPHAINVFCQRCKQWEVEVVI